MHKFINQAIKLAQNSHYENKIHFRHAAIITRGASVISKGINKAKRNAFVSIYSYHKNPGCDIHAEVDAILRARKKSDLRGTRLFVARVSRTGIKISNSRPCPMCINVMQKYGIIKAYYSINKNEYGIIDLNKI